MGTLTNLTHEEAWEIGTGIRKSLMRKGVEASIAVVNRDGRPLFQLAMDLARPFTANVALLKAMQSAKTGWSTKFVGESIAKGERTPQILNLDSATLIKFAGGLPIYDKSGNLLGGAGVSNLLAEEDEFHTRNGIKAAGFVPERSQ